MMNSEAIDNEHAKTCEWTYRESGWYETECDIFISDVNTIDFKYCPYCGKRIKWIA